MLMVLAALALAGCARSDQEVPPTLVPTLELIIVPTNTPLPTDTPIPDTATPTLTDTPTASATPTPSATASPTGTPTFGPSPTGTRTPTVTRIPTRTRIPSRTPTITLTPTITNTPTPLSLSLNLVRPGLMSKVVSPIQMELQAVTGGDGKITIELVGEDGRVISRQVQDFGKPNRHIWISPDLPFEIGAAAETARLQIITYDEYGRAEAETSVDLVLLQVGRNEINPQAFTEEPYLVWSPEPEDVVSGGVLVLEALARPLNPSPLVIELISESGTVINTKMIDVPPPTGALSHTPFTVEIPYKVKESTPVRLVIRQEGSRIPGSVALYSQLITLLP